MFIWKGFLWHWFNCIVEHTCFLVSFILFPLKYVFPQKWTHLQCFFQQAHSFSLVPQGHISTWRGGLASRIFFFSSTLHSASDATREQRKAASCEEALRPPLHIVHLQHIVASPGRCEKSSWEKLEHSFIEAVAHIRCVYHRCFRLSFYESVLLPL